jgi:hypothetical protein
LEEFDRNKSRRDGVSVYCKECNAKVQKGYHENNKARNGPVSIPEFKTCPGCKIQKPGSDFNKNKSCKDGLSIHCKECTAKTSKAHCEKNKARNLVVIPKLKTCPKCKKTLFCDAFSKSKIRKDGLSSVCKECMKTLKKIWTKANRIKINQKTRDRRDTDPTFKLLCNLRRRILLVLRGGSKSSNTLSLIGCPNGEEALIKIRDLFWPGMTEINDGPIKWEVDHIRPLSGFNLTDPEEQKKAFHWSNLQPLWRDDNRNKWKRLDWTPAESKHELPERLKHFKR